VKLGRSKGEGEEKKMIYERRMIYVVGICLLFAFLFTGEAEVEEASASNPTENFFLKIYNVLKGWGLVTVILILCGLATLGVIVERTFFFCRARINADELEKIKQHVKKKRFKEAEKLCESNHTPLSRVIKTGLENRTLPSSELEEKIESARLKELRGMERGLGVLGTIGNIAPLIGLFGTVIGIMDAFGELGGGGGHRAIMGGISEALRTTAVGLAVAIPAVVCYNYFLRKVKNFSLDMSMYGQELLTLLSAKRSLTSPSPKGAVSSLSNSAEYQDKGEKERRGKK
jgi:biopolymer transport protein ExbB